MHDQRWQLALTQQQRMQSCRDSPNSIARIIQAYAPLVLNKTSFKTTVEQAKWLYRFKNNYIS